MNTFASDDMNKSETATAVDKAHQAAEQAQQKAGETAAAAKDQAKRTAAQVQDRAKTTVDTRMGEVASDLGSVASAVRSTSYELQAEDQQKIAHYGERIADQIDQVSSYLNEHGVEDILADAENLARRQPALFLGGAFMLGLVVGRFLRSSGEQGSRSYSGGSYGGYNSGSGLQGSDYRSGYAGRPAVEYGAQTGAGQSRYQQGPSQYNTSNRPEFGDNPTAYPTGLAEE